MSNEIDQYNKPYFCRKCQGELEFLGLGHYKCVKCGFEDYDDYGLVRNYIEQHKGATAGEVSAMTGVSINVINQMLREERFQVSETSKVFMKCDACGKDISSGRYCPMCQKLKEASELKKKQRAMAEARREQMSGVGMQQIGESGAKRFTRER